MRASGGAVRSPIARRGVVLGLGGAVILAWLPALADGGHMALHASSGGYTITLYTAPEPLVTGPVDLSLLVQDAGTGEVIADAQAEGQLTLEPSDAAVNFSMTHEAASNKLLLAATAAVSRAGSYGLVLRVRRGEGPPVAFSAVVGVREDHRRRTTVLFALVVPIVAVLLFLVNQSVKLGRQRVGVLH